MGRVLPASGYGKDREAIEPVQCSALMLNTHAGARLGCA